ncbi:MAG: hypothetical protein CVU59_09725 [Deltaproteobacteria bacterium HGW-Deltaproteobacteria-17]|nr:MAG: hypothetical protein CVU59_09725 [Deltaproteobacteria bacterium HGW-Deltaproteobacteria-17]
MVMKCPYNEIDLVKEVYEADVEIDKCPKCRGIWLDAGELEKIQQTQEIDYSSRLKAAINADAAKFNHGRQLDEASLTCPSCAATMEKQEHGFNKWIVIDFCPQCRGIWLDEGELEALEIYYEQEHQLHPEMTRLQLLLAGFYRYYHRA